MRGTIVIIDPAEDAPCAVALDRPVTLEELKGAVGGGWLEAVPGFTTLPWGGIVMDCVAFCDEEGKLKNLPHNQVATDLWEQSLRRKGVNLYAPHPFRAEPDYLVGPIAVVFGDREFMEKL
jgi:hypothetical protein